MLSKPCFRSVALLLTLQFADMASTAAFISVGVPEGSAMFSFLMRRFGVFTGLLIGKLVMGAVVFLAVKLRPAAIAKANALYFGVIAWNLIAIAWVGDARKGRP